MNKVKTLKQFIEKAEQVHNNKYSYTEAVYSGSKVALIITCKIHGNFNMTPNNHLRGHGCSQCGAYIRSLKNTSETEDFISKAKKVHNNLYNYDKTIYKNTHTVVTITCLKHGDFLQTPNLHLRSNKGTCRECKREALQLKNKNKFLVEAFKVHGDTYEYYLSNYKNNKTKVTIVCKTHGNFLQTPNAHLNGSGCWSCGFIKGSDKSRKTTKLFIIEANKVHKNLFDYSETNYKLSNQKVKIKCKVHKAFNQTPAQHLQGQGCPMCARESTKSLGEKIIETFLTENKIPFETQKKFNDCKNVNALPFDFYLPTYKALIEFDGMQHHNSNSCYHKNLESFENSKIRDGIKSSFAFKNGFAFLRIKDFSSKNKEKQINKKLGIFIENLKYILPT